MYNYFHLRNLLVLLENYRGGFVPYFLIYLFELFDIKFCVSECVEKSADASF